jgi:hypothetical protein
MRLLTLISVLALSLTLAFGASSMANTTTTDPTGDSCTTADCGWDIQSVSDTVAADGSATFSITRNTDWCGLSVYPALVTQAAFMIYPAAATTPVNTDTLGMLWAYSGGSTSYQWTATGSSVETPVTATVTSTAITVQLPASIVTALGGLPLKYVVTNSCRNSPYTPVWEPTDLAPDSGVYTLAAPTTTPTPDTTKPKVTSVTAPPLIKFALLLAKGYKSSLVCSEACKVAAKLTIAGTKKAKAPIVIGTGSARRASKGKVSVKVKLNAKGKALKKKKAKSIKSTLALTVTDTAGNATKKSKPVSIKLKP